MFSCLSSLGKSVLIVALAAGLLTQFFPCCAFAIRSFSKVSATHVDCHMLHSLDKAKWVVLSKSITEPYDRLVRMDARYRNEGQRPPPADFSNGFVQCGILLAVLGKNLPIMSQPLF